MPMNGWGIGTGGTGPGGWIICTSMPMTGSKCFAAGITTEALHAPALHAPALYAPALHAPALHAPALHAPALHASALHAPALPAASSRHRRQRRLPVRAEQLND